MRLVPCAVGSSTGSLAAGILMQKSGKYKILGVALVGTFALGSGLLSLLNLASPEWPVWICLALNGIGYGGLLTVTLLAAISAVDHEHQAVITSATYAFRSTGSTIGVTIGSAVFQNILNTRLWAEFGKEAGAADEIKRIRDNFDELRRLPPGWHDGVFAAYKDALQGVFLTAFGVVILGLICAGFMRQHTLHTTLARK